jgi:hypothetical protein
VNKPATSERSKEKTSVTIWRAGLALALCGITAAVCFWGSPPAAKSESGIDLNLPDSVGKFWGTRQEISEGERVILPPDTEFAKKLYADGQGDNINCQIVLAGAEKRSIHRPEVCLPGQGWVLRSGDVIPIQLDNGQTLQVMNLTISRPVTLQNGQQKELTSYFIYWFVGKDTTTPRHLVRILKTNLDMLLHNTNHRWAYIIVSSPILEGFTPDGKNAEQTLDMLKKFIGEVAPQIMQKEQKAAVTASVTSSQR